MKCPACESNETKRKWTRHSTSEDGDPYTKRRRLCMDCGHRYTTFECYELADVEAAFRLRDAEPLMKQLRATLFGAQVRTQKTLP